MVVLDVHTWAGLLADGVATYLRLASEGRSSAPPPYAAAQTSVPPSHQAGGLPPHVLDEMITPPSVTEATTRHLGVPAEPKRRDE